MAGDNNRTGADRPEQRTPPRQQYAGLFASWAARTDPWLWLILAAAFVWRLAYGPLLGLGTPPEGRPFLIDEQEYYAAAQMLAAGHGFAFYDTFAWTRAPLYPLLVAGLFRVFGVAAGPVLLVQALLSTLTLYWLATLAGRIAGRAAGGPSLITVRAARRLTALVGGLWLSFTLFTQLLVSETLFLCLFVGTLVLLARWADGEGTRWRLLLGAGAVLGLAALTRSTALAFLPLAAGWVWWVGRAAVTAGARPGARGGSAHALLPVLWLLAGAVGVIAPWTARNIVAYGVSPGGPVLIDTSSGYNLWLAANGVHDAERLANELQGIPGVLARQQHAMTQARDQIAADPGAFLAKSLKEAGDLWTINYTAEERQVRGYLAGRVPAAHLLALFALDDGLYGVIVLLALVGLAVARPDPLKALIGLWTLVWVAIAFVFFAVTRFRFPLVACLLPWVPLGWATLAHRVGQRRLMRRRAGWAPLALLALGVIFLIGVGPSFIQATGATAQGISRWNEQAPFRQAEDSLRYLAGRDYIGRVLPLYASANPQIADTRFGTLAAQVIEAGTNRTQLETLAGSPYLEVGPTGVYSTRMESAILLGQIARRLGDAPRAARLFTSRAVNDATPAALDWAATHLGPPGEWVSDPHVDVGSGLDVGLVQGMYPAEREGDVTYRWTGQDASLVPPSPGATRLRLRWNGWRPAGWPAAHVQFSIKHCGVDTCFTQTDTLSIPNDTAWHEAELNVAPPRLLEVKLRINAFVPGGFDPRTLGVRIDSVEWK
jgi:4-amino-4-deoxy-L-arabinose transferase-like glycosyltransferase